VMPLSTFYRSNFVSQVNTTVSLQEWIQVWYSCFFLNN
jgi:hypothetical protein